MLTSTLQITNLLEINNGTTIARINSEGVFHVLVEPTDENAITFIDLVNKILLQDRQKLTHVDYSHPQ